MTNPVVNVLHVEDDPVQHLVVRQLLDRVGDRRFSITIATGEEEAVAAFGSHVELVVLGYHLTNGNGLSCLRRIKKVRVEVPVLVVSGVASPQVAAELLEAGADDFYGKEWLDPDGFAAGVRQALARSDARKWTHSLDQSASAFRTVLEPLVKQYLAAFSPEIGQRIAAAEKAARDAGLGVSPVGLERIFGELAATNGPDAVQRLRPLLLELAVRLYGYPIKPGR